MLRRIAYTTSATVGLSMIPSSCIDDKFCDSPHRRGTCSVLGTPFPVYICERRVEVCSDMNGVAEWFFRLFAFIWDGHVVIHGEACPPSRMERLLQ